MLWTRFFLMLALYFEKRKPQKHKQWRHFTISNSKPSFYKWRDGAIRLSHNVGCGFFSWLLYQILDLLMFREKKRCSPWHPLFSMNSNYCFSDQLCLRVLHGFSHPWAWRLLWTMRQAANSPYFCRVAHLQTSLAKLTSGILNISRYTVCVCFLL